MPFALRNTPSTRLTVLVTFGTLALAATLGWAVQPATGPTLDITVWRLFSIPVGFWVCVIVGYGAYLISTWIWALKPRDPATSLFAASGLMTLLFTFASTYDYMAAPLPAGLVGLMLLINMLSACAFGVIMICLFLIYPGRLPYWRYGTVATVIVFGGWTAAALGPLHQIAIGQLITLTEMIVIIAAGLWQIVHARNDPRQRAIAVWLGASVLLGAGFFIGTVALPITFGQRPLIDTDYAFASFLLIYAGLAVGLIRYRLFELGGWAFQLIFHIAAALAILVIDAFLIGSLSLAPGAALSLAVLAIAFVYLPLREYAWRRLAQRRTADEAEIFHSVIDTALKPSGPQRAQSWERLLQDMYQPLELTPSTSNASAPVIDAEGLALHLPAIADSPALTLRYPHAGRSLFSPRDLATAGQVIVLMRHAEESRGAYDRGVTEERTRIARDIHDNIGAQLLRALHSGPAERKDAMIRDTLADLRDVINNAQSPDLPLDLVLADLRAETADRLSPHGISLTWDVAAMTDLPMKPARVHALRSLVREATSNTIKHAGASAMTVRITTDPTSLALVVEDDGHGFTAETVSLGHGLDNMKARTESLGGAFSLTSKGKGTRLSARLPLQPEPPTP